MIVESWQRKTIAVPNETNSDIQQMKSLKWLVLSLRVITVLMGGLYAWAAAASHSMNADGISYLDMGDAYMRGDWQTAINTVWSPMYAWVLGLTLRVLSPPLRWEFPTVHLVNFLIFLFALICFEFFWRQVMRLHRVRITTWSDALQVQRHDDTIYAKQTNLHIPHQIRSISGQQSVGFPDWAMQSLGYLIFMTVSLILIKVWAVTPDLLMSAFVYLVSGMIVQIRLGIASRRLFIILGLLLGLSYLTKAIMFPVAILFLVMALLTVGNVRLAVSRVLLSGLFFLIVTAPYVAMISSARGRLTIGEAGTYTYAKHVNDIPFHHWQGDTLGNGTPVHPTRQIFDEPPIYEFGSPIGGTYPVNYDPTYWHEGLELNFDLERQIRVIIASAMFYLDQFSNQFGALTFGVLLLYAIAHQGVVRPKEFIARWGLAVVAMGMFAFYGVIAVIGRYIGAFLVLLWADLLAEVRLSDSAGSRRLISVISWLMLTFLFLNLASFSLSGYNDLASGMSLGQGMDVEMQPPDWPGEVTESLFDLGIEPGDSVAIIGYGFDSYWARLARVRIVAEMLEWQADPFWLGTPAFQKEVIEVFAKTGAKAIVAENVPHYAQLPGWHQVGNSNFFIFLLTGDH